MAIDNAGLGVEYSTQDEFFQFILNDLFLPAVADTVINPNVLLRSIPRDTTHVEGKNVVFPIHTGRNFGVNSIAPEGLLPDAGSQGYDRYAFMVRHIYGRVKFSGISLDASRTQVASWLNVLKSEIEGLSMDMSRYRQRVYHNDGSGRVGEVSATAGAGTILTVTVHASIPGSTASFDPVKFLKAGMRVAFIGTPAGVPVLRGNASEILSVDKALGTITFAVAPAAVVVGDGIVLASTLDTGLTLADCTWQNDPMGLAGIVNDTNPLDGTANGFQGIDATAVGNEYHRANMDGKLQNGGTNRTLSLSLMDHAYQRTQEIAEMDPDIILGSFGTLRAYAQRVLTDRRFAGSSEPQAFDGGYSALSYNGSPIIPDRDCYSNRLYFLSLPGFKFHVMAEPQWMDLDGSIYHRIPNRDQYQATLYVRETLGHDVRDQNTLMTDLAEV